MHELRIVILFPIVPLVNILSQYEVIFVFLSLLHYYPYFTMI